MARRLFANEGMFRFIASLEIQVIYDFYSAVILEERESYIGYLRKLEFICLKEMRCVMTSIKWIFFFWV